MGLGLFVTAILFAAHSPTIARAVSDHVPVEPSGRIQLNFTPAGSTRALFFSSGGLLDPETVRSLRGLHAGLRLYRDGKLVPASQRTPGGIVLPRWVLQGESLEVRLFGIPFAKLNRGPRGRGWRVGEVTSPLTSFDLRLFARMGSAYGGEFARISDLQSKLAFTPRTDLHTHFAAALRSETLLEAGRRWGLTIPVSTLREAGIRLPLKLARRFPSQVPVSELDRGSLIQLRGALSIPVNEVVGFTELERIYRLRDPLAKDPRVLAFLLDELLADYKRAGIHYVELSLADVIDPTWLRIIHAELPALEAKHSVSLRFLAALRRDRSNSVNRALLDIVETAARASPYIVGVDFMGHETNMTGEFADSIRAARRVGESLAIEGWVVRVHAGENRDLKTNVRDAIEAGATRIGHGNYGSDPEVLALAARHGVTIESNPTSNIALNAATEAGDFAGSRYRSARVDFALGSDGHGLFQGGGASEVRGAIYGGMGSDDFDAIERHERRLIARMERQFQARLRRNPSLAVPDLASAESVKSRDDRVAARALALRNARESARARGIPFHGHLGELEVSMRGRRPVYFATANLGEHMALGGEHWAKGRDLVRSIVWSLDGNRSYIVVDALPNWISDLVQEEVALFNSFRPPGHAELRQVSLHVSDLAAFDRLEPSSIAWSEGNLYDRAEPLARFIKRNRGVSIHVAGGDPDRQLALVERRQGVKRLFFSGVEGEATKEGRLDYRRAKREVSRALRGFKDLIGPDAIQERALPLGGVDLDSVVGEFELGRLSHPPMALSERRFTGGLEFRLNTSNAGKAAEFAAISNGVFRGRTSLDLEEVVADPVTVVVQKASQLKPVDAVRVVVEDTILEVDGAEIGVNVRWAMEGGGLREHVGKRATWTTRLAYREGDQIRVYTGTIQGRLVEPRGSGGFGFDPYFLPDGADFTLAESKPPGRSARWLAMRAFLEDQGESHPAIDDWDGAYQGHGADCLRAALKGAAR